MLDAPVGNHRWVLNCHPHSCHSHASRLPICCAPSLFCSRLAFMWQNSSRAGTTAKRASKRFWLSALWIGERSEEYLFFGWWLNDLWTLLMRGLCLGIRMHHSKHTLPWKCRTSDVCGATSATLQLSSSRFDLTSSAAEEQLTENSSTANFLVISLQEQGTNKISQ